MWRARNSPVTGPAKRWFRLSVNQSCSGMKRAFSYWLLALSLNPNFFGSNFRSGTARQSDPQLIGGFARDRSYGQEQARKQPVETRGGNREYSIGGEAHQNVAKQEAQHHSLAGLGMARLRCAVCQGGHDSLQPVEIQVGDSTSARESQGYVPAIAPPGSRAHSQREYEHDARDAIECAGIEG